MTKKQSKTSLMSFVTPLCLLLGTIVSLYFYFNPKHEKRALLSNYKKVLKDSPLDTQVAIQAVEKEEVQLDKSESVSQQVSSKMAAVKENPLAEFQDQLEELKDFSLDDDIFSPSLVAAGKLLETIRDRLEEDRTLLEPVLGFYKGCVEGEHLKTPLRALCLFELSVLAEEEGREDLIDETKIPEKVIRYAEDF